MNAEAQILGPGVAGERDPRPVVALPRSGLPGAAIAAICFVLAVFLFLFLNSRREAAERQGAGAQTAPATAFAAPPPLALPVEQRQMEPAPLRILTQPSAPLRLRVSPPAPAVRPQTRWMPAPVPSRSEEGEPFFQPQPVEEATPPPMPVATLEESALVMDARGGGGTIARGVSGATADSSGQAGTNGPSGAAGARDRPTPRLSAIGDPATVMPVGTLIQAVLETPIDTFKPGLARAVVSRDARGFNGRQVLVPRGSRLTGEYQSDARSGQNRVLITWTQLIRPDGTTIRLDSPAADSLGGAGVAGKADGSALGRFATGVLRTALAVGSSWASWSGSAPVIVGLPGAQLPAAVAQGRGSGRSQRIRVKQGTAFNVFVARNLDFSDVASTR